MKYAAILSLFTLSCLFTGGCSENKDQQSAPAKADVPKPPPSPNQFSGLQEIGNELNELIVAGDYAPVTAQLLELRDNIVKTNDGFNAYFAITSSMTENAEMGDAYLQWLKQEPDNPIPHVLYGLWCVNEAWNHRGGGWAYLVSEIGWENFERYLLEAKGHLVKAYELDPKEYAACAQMITVSMGDSDKGDVMMWLERATEHNPTFYMAYDKVAYALYPRWQGEDGESLAFIKEHIDIDPTFQWMLVDWIESESDDADKLEDKDSQTALRIAHEMVERYPDSGFAERRLAVLLRCYGMDEEAMVHYQKAVEKDPSVKNLRAYAYRLYKLNRAVEALELYEQALELEPNNIETLEAIARCYHYGDGVYNLDKAIELYQLLMKLQPGDRWTPINLGDCYLWLHQYEKALNEYQYTVKTWPRFGAAYYRLGKAYYLMDDKTKAELAFTKAIDLDPDYEDNIARFLKEQGE